VEEHASSHEEDVCIEEAQIVAYNTPSELTDEADDSSVLDGNNEDATSFPSYDDYEEIFQSTDGEDLTYFPMYDADDEDGYNVLAPNYDAYSTPHPIYELHDDAYLIVPEYDKG
jgi:hypothetical protein